MSQINLLQRLRGKSVVKALSWSFCLTITPDDPVKVFFDMDADVGSLLKLIGISESEGIRLLKKEKLSIPPYRLTYFPRRLFSIDKGHYTGHPFVNFSNMGQYQDTHFERNNTPGYAIEQAKQAVALAKDVQDTLAYLGLDTEKLTSPVAAFRERIKSLDLPTIDDVLPQEASEMAFASIKGNWLEAYSSGYWPGKIYDYDINSAYPAELSQLLDIRKGRWVKHKTPIQQAAYGFAEGYLTTHANFHPFLYRRNGKQTYTPQGRWRTYLTLQEIDFLYDYKLGEFEPIRGYWWLPYGKQSRPFEGVINWLFEKRLGTTGLRRMVIQRIGAGLWGKMGEFRGETLGPNFNAVYAAIVEANTRLKVAKTCLDCGLEPLHIAIDGIITDKPLPVESSQNLGQWRLSHEGSCIIVGASTVAFEGKGGPQEFSLKFDWLLKEMLSHPRATNYKMSKLSPVSLALACNGKWDQLGKIIKTTRTVSIGSDQKRLWGKRALNGGQLLKLNPATSEPWDYTVVAGGDDFENKTLGGEL